MWGHFGRRVHRAVGLAALLLSMPGCPQTEPTPDARREPIWGREDLAAVQATSAERALVAARSGAIYQTLDAGESWTVSRAAQPPGLRDLAMADPETGWAVGPGRILRTRDGGRSWVTQTLPAGLAELDWTAVAAVDRERAVVVGERGATLVTLDGGRHWRAAAAVEGEPLVGTEASAPTLRDVFCQAQPVAMCWSVGDRGVVRVSNDSGERWEPASIESRFSFEPLKLGRGRVELDPESVASLVQLAESLRGEADQIVEIEPVTARAEIERLGRTEDPFALFEILDARAEDARTVLEEAGLPAERLFVRGEPPWSYRDYLDDEPGFLARYWTERMAPEPGIRIHVREQPGLRAVYFRDATQGWAIGDEDEVFRTHDGGRSWRSAGHAGAHALYALAWSRQGGIMVGAQGTLRTTRGEGASWQAPSPPRAPIHFDDYLDIDFSPDGTLGLIAGEGGWCLRSVDGGASWEALGRGTG